MIRYSDMIVQYDNLIPEKTIDKWLHLSKKIFDGKTPESGKTHGRNNHGFMLSRYRQEPLVELLGTEVHRVGFEFLERYGKDVPLIGYNLINDLPVQANFYYRRYGVGDNYHWHVDKTHKPTHELVISILIYLNDNFEGGHTKFLIEKLKVKPKKGSVLMFPCGPHYIHKSSVITSGNKHVLWNCFSQSKTDAPHSPV